MIPSNFVCSGIISNPKFIAYTSIGYDPVPITDYSVRMPIDQIKEVLDSFDFRLANRLCKLLRWKVNMVDSIRVMTEFEMRNLARNLLHTVIIADRRMFETVSLIEDGFMATYDGAKVKLFFVPVSA